MLDAIADCNRSFAIPDILTCVAGPGGLPMLQIRNDLAQARILLHGAHVLDFQPRDAGPLLWLSTHSRFERDAPVRGGIPVCWPWFGPHPDDPELPAHGLARTRTWQLAATSQLPDGQTEVVFALHDDDGTRGFWPHAFRLEYRVRVGQYLDCRLTTTNTGPSPCTITQALHSYLNVSNVEDIRIRGLEHRQYLDKLDGMTRREQQGPVVFDGEVDRIYIDSDDICYCDDPGRSRCLVVAKEGSRSTVIWNPWIDKAASMPDFGDEEYIGMLCIETANAGPDAIELTPDASHTLRTLIGIESIGFELEDLQD